MSFSSLFSSHAAVYLIITDCTVSISVLVWVFSSLFAFTTLHSIIFVLSLFAQLQCFTLVRFLSRFTLGTLHNVIFVQHCLCGYYSLKFFAFSVALSSCHLVKSHLCVTLLVHIFMNMGGRMGFYSLPLHSIIFVKHHLCRWWTSSSSSLLTTLHIQDID